MRFATQAAVFSLAVLLCAGAPAQDPEGENAAEIIKKIQADLDSLVNGFSGMSEGNLSTEGGERVVENIEKLLSGMSQEQDRIVGNIDELIRQLKQKQSQSPSSSDSGSSSGNKPSGKKPQNGKPRDRNQKPQDGQRPSKPENPGKEPGEDGEPKNGQENQKPGEQTRGNRRPPGSPEEKVAPVDDAENWGNLPLEAKQILIEHNFREYFPDYEREISDYLKSLNRKKN